MPDIKYTRRMKQQGIITTTSLALRPHPAFKRAILRFTQQERQRTGQNIRVTTVIEALCSKASPEFRRLYQEELKPRKETATDGSHETNLAATNGR